MKGILRAFLVLAFGVMAASFAFASDEAAPKNTKGIVSVVKGTDGKITSVTVNADVGQVVIAPENFAKFEKFNGKKVELMCVKKDGKFVASGDPKAVEEKKPESKGSGKSKKL